MKRNLIRNVKRAGSTREIRLIRTVQNSVVSIFSPMVGASDAHAGSKIVGFMKHTMPHIDMVDSFNIYC